MYFLLRFPMRSWLCMVLYGLTPYYVMWLCMYSCLVISQGPDQCSQAVQNFIYNPHDKKIIHGGHNNFPYCQPIEPNMLMFLVNWYQRSAFQSVRLATTLVATIFIILFFFFCWHKRASFQWLAFGRLTAGNDVVATKFSIQFFFPCLPPFFFSVATFSHRRSARIKKLI